MRGRSDRRGDGLVALAALGQGRLDVLISDIAMPEDNGDNPIRKVRARDAKRGGRIPALALPPYARIEDRAAAISAGYQQYAVRPIERVELGADVATLAGRHGGRTRADEKDRAETSRRCGVRAARRRLLREEGAPGGNICVPFLKAGMESNEMCVWVIAEPLTERDAWAALSDAVPALDRYRADRRIETLQSQTWYVTGDTPDLHKVARGWEAKLADALGRGYEGLRVAASAPQLEEKHGDDFFDYEDRLNQYLSDKAMLVLCAYPVAAPRAADVTRTHPSTIRKRRGEWEVH